MGYETNLIVTEKIYNCDFVLATFDLCKLGYDFDYDIFDIPIENHSGGLYVGLVGDEQRNSELDELIKTDLYGAELKGATIDDVVRELTKISDYDRAVWVAYSLMAIKSNYRGGGELIVYHYGY